MAGGLVLGRVIPDLNTTIERIKIDTVSLPITVGLLAMMYPVLAKVRYSRIGDEFADRRTLGLSLVLNWLIGPLPMFTLAWVFLSDLPELRLGLINRRPRPLHCDGATCAAAVDTPSPSTGPCRPRPALPPLTAALGASMSSPIVILAGARTPIGKLSGSLGLVLRRRARRVRHRAPPSNGPDSPASRSTTSTWATSSRPAPGRSPPARPRSTAASPWTCPATTVNKVCLSGMDAIYQADRRIRCR